MSEPFSDYEQVEMSIKAAEKMVGTATMSMDAVQIHDAAEVLDKAKADLQRLKAHSQGKNEPFFEISQALLNKVDHQLKEARNE